MDVLIWVAVGFVLGQLLPPQNWVKAVYAWVTSFSVTKTDDTKPGA